MEFQLTYDAFRVFDEAALKFRTFVLAFSGGKDSTAVAVLLFRWLAERARRGEKLPNVVLLHNDTLSEIPEMEEWVDFILVLIIKKIDVTATGSLEVVAHVKWNGHLAQVVFQDGWKIHHGGFSM